MTFAREAAAAVNFCFLKNCISSSKRRTKKDIIIKYSKSRKTGSISLSLCIIYFITFISWRFTAWGKLAAAPAAPSSCCANVGVHQSAPIIPIKIYYILQFFYKYIYWSKPVFNWLIKKGLLFHSICTKKK